MGRYSEGHKEASRDRIVAEASAQFRRNGIATVGVRGLMTEVGLTHGTFYTHFLDRSDLVAAAINHALDSNFDALRKVVEEAPEDEKLSTLVTTYLRPVRDGDLAFSCAISSLAPEIAREKADTRACVVSRQQRLVHLIASTLPPGGSDFGRLERANAVFATMLGTLQLTRIAIEASDAEATMVGGSKAALLIGKAPW